MCLTGRGPGANETPTLQEALDTIAEFIADQRGGEYDNVAKAADVVLQDHAQLGRRVADLETRVAGLDEQIRLLSTRLQQEADRLGSAE